MNHATVLVVDDKEMLRDSVGATLARAGMQVSTADGGEAALSAIARQRPDCVVTDLKMPGMDGLALIEAVRRLDDELPVILMTAFGTVETAVRAMKLGAFDYVTKPFEGDELIISVKRAVEHGRLVRENAILKSAGAGSSQSPKSSSGAALAGLHRLVGDSAAIRRVKEQVLAVAESAGTVLICGESGTGKEVVARAIHELSPRDGQAFLGVNCAALSDTLLESELFGHEKGAFTGAEKLRKGRFELADRGTLLLDEISETPPRLQAKLLRVLQERVFERVGSSTAIGCDVRVIATSNRDLPKAVARNEFRQDLFFRLNVLPVHLPPLRDRLEDVPALVQHFMQQIATREGGSRAPLSFHPDALDVLMSYSWPGNVRELQNIAERAAVLCRAGSVVGPELIRPWLGQGWAATGAGGLAQAISGAEHPFINGHANGHANGLVNGFADGSTHVHSGGHGTGGGLAGSIAELKPASAVAVSAQPEPLEEVERRAIVSALKAYNGHRQKTAIALGIGVRTLGLNLKKWKSQNLVEATL
ncbi:MAG: sigma-54 dependent transcriptional regulator [Phycisphaerales bacterium]|nr:sigma-54 dependent transcriptional regulator [Phycisphaerales bacterium]